MKNNQRIFEIRRVRDLLGPARETRCTPNSGATLIKKALALVAIVATGLVSVRAQTCPQLLGGQMFGPTDWQADGSADEKTYYRYITDDDHMKLDSIFYCLDSETETHFQGFVATFENTENKSKQAFPFGVTTQTAADTCRGFYVKQEIQWLKVKQDVDDIEGLIMGNTELDLSFPLMTTDIGEPATGDSPVLTFPGRLIGFGVTTALNTRGENEQIVRVGPVFNNCNCVGSTFNPESPPAPMRVVSGTGEGSVQTLIYRNNVIEQWYGQDCGGQTVALVAQVSPSPLEIEVGSSGALSPKGETYIDTLSIGAASKALVGRWNFALQYKQEAGQGSYNKKGEEVFMPPLMLPFFVQVDPCPIESFSAETPTEQIRHVISDSIESRSLQYNFIQDTACDYEQTYSFLDMPDFVSWDEEERQLVILTADEQDINSYTITVVSTIEAPDDFSMQSFSEWTATSVITLEVSGLPVECLSTEFEAFDLSDLEGSVHGVNYQEIQLQPVSDSASSSNGNSDGFSYCGDRQFKIENPASISSFLSLDQDGVITFESTRESDIGQYEVDVTMFLAKGPDVSRTQTMTVTINPCVVLSYTAVITLGTIDYEIRSGPLSSDQFLFESDPKDCNYEQSLTLSDPNFMQHDSSNGIDRLTIESNDEGTANGEIQATVTSTINIPTDYTMQATESLSASFEFTIVMNNPYELICTEVTIDSFGLQDMQTRVFGETFEQLLPIVQDSSEGRCGAIKLESKNPSSFENFLQVTAEEIVLQSNSAVDEGRYEIEMLASLEDYPTQKRLVSFFVTIDPCQIADFTIQMADQTYRIGSGKKDLEYYTIETVPAECNTFDQQAVFSGLPSFMESSNDSISAETNEISDADTYPIDLSVTFRVPTDYTRSNVEDSQTSSISFTVTVIDTCEETILDAVYFEDVLLSVLGGEVSRDLPLKVQDSVSRATGNQDGLTSCGERVFALFGAEGQSYYTVSSQTEDIVFQSSNSEDIGRFTLEIEITLKNYPGVPASTTTFALTIDPCRVSSFTGVTLPNSGTQQVGQDLQTSFEYKFTQASSCSYTESVEVIGLPDFMTHNVDESNFSFYTDQVREAGEYTVTIASTIQVPEDYTSSSYTPFVSETSFSLQVVAGCEYSSFENWSLDGSSFSATVKGEIVSGQLGSAQDSVSLVMGEKDGFSFCGNRAYIVVNESEVSGFLTIDQSKNSITLQSTNDVDIGSYNVDIQISLQEYPQITEIATVSVIIGPCQILDFKGTVTEAPISYSVDTPATSGGLYSFSQTPSCGYGQTISIDGMTEFITHDSVSKTFSVETDDPQNEATYDITVESTIDVPDDWTKNSFTQVKSSVNFQIIVQEECGETILDDLILIDMIIQDEGGVEVQTFSEVQDSVSKELGNKDGISFCGARKYEIIEPELHYSYLSILGTEITGFTVDNDAIGVHQVQIKVSLFDNPAIFKIAEFRVTIDPCQVTDFEIIFGPQDQQYMIQAALMSLGFFKVEQMPCSHPVTFELVTPYSFITLDQDLGEIMVQTDDLDDENVYLIETRVRITVPMGQGESNLEQFESVFSFELDIINPCTLTQLDDLILEDMAISVLGETSIQIFGEVEDFESRVNVNGDNSGLTFCGPRIYTIFGEPSFAQINEATREISVATHDDQNIGLQQLELLVQLQDYPQVATTAFLQVTINPCEITDYIVSMNPLVISYTVNDPALTAFAYSFTQTNLCGYSETVTIQTQTPTDFIIHNEADQDFTIYTDLRENADIYTLIVQSTISVFDDYTLASETEHSVQTSFQVTVQDPCAATEFLEFIIPDLAVKVHDISSLESLVPDIKDTVSEAAGDSNGSIFCGERTYELIDSQLHESYMTFDDQVLTVLSEDNAEIGFYEAQVKVSLVDYPDIFKLADFSITIAPCVVTSLEGTGGPDDAEYGVKEPSISLGFVTISQEFCTYPVIYELVEPKAFITVDQNTGEVLVQSDSQEDEELHTIQVMASIQVPNDYSNTDFETLKSYHSFELSVYVPCKRSEFDEPVLVEMTTSVLGESQSQTFGEVQDSESRARGDDTGLIFCGPRIYSIVGSPSYIQFDQETREITLSTEDDANIAQLEVELQVALQDFPSVTKIVSFQVTINPCKISDYTASIDPMAIDYLVNDPSETTFAYIFAQTNLCGYPETITIDNPTDFIIHNEADKDFTIYTDLRANVEVYTVTVQSSIQVYDDHTQLTQTEHSAETQFQVTVSDPCRFAQLEDIVIPDMALQVHDQPLEQRVLDIQDTVSQSAGNSDGLTFCGERIYELIDPSQHEDFLTFSQQVLTIFSDDNSEISVYTAQVKVSLADYPDIFKIADFEITIDPCEVTKFEITSGPYDTDYAISAVKKSLDLPIISQDSCTYPVIYELVTPQEFLTIDKTTGEIQIETDDRGAEDIYQIEIKASISTPNDNSNTEFTTIESSHTLELSLFVPMDLCSLTQLDETILVDLTTSVLGTSQKQSFEEVQDTESKASGDQSGLTFCGPRLYSIVGSPSYIQFDEETREITLKTQEQQDIGQFKVEVLIKLQDFPGVTTKSQFQVTVNPCEITDYIENIDSATISYTINDPAVTTFAYSFTQSNLCGYPEKITIDNPTDFITHNEVDQDFTIYTASRGEANIYTIAVASKITVFDDHTQTSQTDHFAEALLQITVIDPCVTTEFSDFVISDLLVKVHESPFTETVPDMQDSFSQTIVIDEDGTSFCGDKTYELIDSQQHDSYLTFVDSFLTLSSEDDTQIGIYEAQIKVSLVEYPEISEVADFALIINPCEVESFEIQTGPEATQYAISSDQKALDLPTIGQGVCKYPVAFEVVTPQLFMTIDENTGVIKIQTDDREAEDIYQVEIRATSTIPTDSSGTQYTTLESIHSFELRLYVPLDLCRLTDLDEPVLTDMRTSILGIAEAQSFDPVQDTESKSSGDQSGLTFCGPRLYSIVGSPSYIQLDEESREIRVSSQDEQDIGQFEVELLIQLQDFPDVTRRVPFQVTVNPCEITDYVLNTDLTEISYTVRDSAVTTFAYSFTQTNLCGYPETITIDNPTDFIIHNEIDQDFTIQTNLHDNADIYSIAVSSKISVFDDHTLTSETEHSASVQLQVTIIDPCLQTELLDFQIPDLNSFFEGEVLTRELPIVQDSVSQEKAQDQIEEQNETFFCGERVYKIISADSEFLTIVDGLTFAFDTSMVAKDTEYIVEVQVTLKNYPQLDPVSAPVSMKVYTCRLDAIEQPEEIAATYSIRTPEISVNFEKFRQEPDCGIPLTYEFTVENETGMPSWLTPDPISRSMTIISNEVEDEGEYVVLITGSTPAGYAYDQLSKTLRVTLDMKFDCAQDEITSLDQIQDQKMSLEQISVRNWIEPNFQQIRDSCTKSYQLQKKTTSSTWDNLSDSELAVISVDQSNGQIMLEYDARELDGQTWTLKLIVVNSAGNQSQETEFDMNFIDACWEEDLIAPMFQQSEYTFELYQDSLEILFAPLQVERDCGGVWNELQYVSNSVTEKDIILKDTNLESELIDRKWIGIHTFSLKSFNGNFDLQSPYGNQGLWNSVFSETVTVTVTDPCTISKISASTLFPESLSIQAGQTIEEIEFTGPQNSVSTQYGNGYDKCGPLAYQVLSDKMLPSRSTQFSLKAETDLVNGDNLTLKVKSAAGNGPVITESLIIKVYLRQIEGAEPLLIPIDVSYRECEVVEYLAPMIVDQVFTYQSFDPLVIYFDFNQGSCTFGETITAFKVDSENISIKEQLPAFITLSSSEQSITISKPSSFVTLGEYTIELRGTLSNTISTTSSSQFSVSVINADLVEDKIEEEDQFDVPQTLGLFELLLSDQIVTVGQSLTYPINYMRIDPDQIDNKLPTISGEIAGNQPFLMQTSIGMQKIKSFAKFEQNELIIEEERLTNKDIGFYTISVQASFTNGTHTKIVDGRFRLEVRSQPISKVDEPKNVKIVPENVIKIQEWDGLVEYSEKTAEEIESSVSYSPDQPVPYVQNLSETGVLTIMWDRIMHEIQDVTQVPPAEVMIRENQARRSLLDYWLKNDINESYELVGVKKAVEISLLKEEDQDKLLDWFVLESNPELFRIQILFKSEDLVSETPTIQHLKVVFWGTEFFKSQKTDVAVRLGTTIQWPIYNQIRQEQAEMIDEIKKDSRLTLMAGLLLMVPFCTLGTLLPTWMFINTMQLLVHLPLMNAQLPPTVHSILEELLGIAKLDWLILSNNEENSAILVSQDQPLFDQIRLACGYTDTYVLYFTLGLVVAINLSLVQICIGKMMNKYCEKQMLSASKICGTFSNFAIRLFYILFLEACLSMCINIFTAKSSQLMKITSFGLTTLFAFFVLFFILFLFCGSKYGPQTSDLYKKYTILQSLNGVRPFKDQQALEELVMSDPELYKFAMGHEQRQIHIKEIEAKKQLKNKPWDEPSKCPQYLETQVTHRGLLSEAKGQQHCTELETGQEELFTMNILRTSPDDLKENPLMARKVSEDINIPVPQTQSRKVSNEVSLIEQSQHRPSIDSNQSKDMVFLQINENSEETKVIKKVQLYIQKGSLASFQPSSIDLGTDSRNIENNIQSENQSAAQLSSSASGQIHQGAKTGKHRALAALISENISYDISAGRQTVEPKCDYPTFNKSSIEDLNQNKSLEETELNILRLRNSLRTGMTNRTDEFLTDQCSVEPCHQIGEVNVPDSKSLSPINEQDLNEFEQQQLEGGEKEDSEITQGDLQQDNQNQHANENSSIRIAVNQLQDLQSVQANNLGEDTSFSRSSNCNPQSHNSNRARTKLNQRGVDLANVNLSFQKPTSNRRSESVNYDHGFGDFQNDNFLGEDLQVVGMQTSEIIKEDSYSFAKVKNQEPDEDTLRPSVPMPYISTENSEHQENEEITIIIDSALIARIKTKLESEIVLSPRYRTIFSGLKMNHPRNVALVHPVAFLLRRILFVASLMYFLEQPVFSVLIFMCLTLVMLAYGVHEKQWEAPAMNRQNIFNETILYSITALLFFCRGNLSQVEVHGIVGPTMLALIGSLVVVNLMAMLYCCLRIALLCLKRAFGTQKEKVRLTVKHSLRKDIEKIVISIDNDQVFSPTMSYKSKKSVKSLNNFQDSASNEDEEVDQFEAIEDNPNRELVKVSTTQTSFWKRIFYRKKQNEEPIPSAKRNTTPELMLIDQLNLQKDQEDGEAGLIKIIASSSGGFQGCFKQIAVTEGTQKARKIADEDNKIFSQDNLMIEIQDQNSYDPMGIFKEVNAQKDCFQPSSVNSNSFVNTGRNAPDIKQATDCVSQQRSLRTDRECMSMSAAYEFQSQYQGENNPQQLQHSFIAKGGGALLNKGLKSSIQSMSQQPQNNQVSTSVIHNNTEAFELHPDLRRHDSQHVDEFVSGCEALQKLNQNPFQVSINHDAIITETSPQLLDISGAHVPQLSAPGTPSMETEHCIEDSRNDVIIPQISLTRSPATDLRLKKYYKPYLINDLNSILQQGSIEEGTPSVDKAGRDLTSAIMNIEEEIEKELQLKGFDDIMRQRTEDGEEITLFPKRIQDSSEEEIMNELRVIEQGISQVGINDDLTTPWAGYNKANNLKNIMNSVIHEVDEQSLASRAVTPAGDFFKKGIESPNFNTRKSMKSLIEESPEASIIINIGQKDQHQITQDSPTLKIRLPETEESMQNSIYNLSGSKIKANQAGKLAQTLQNCVPADEITPFSGSTKNNKENTLHQDAPFSTQQSNCQTRNKLIGAKVMSLPQSPSKDTNGNQLTGLSLVSYKRQSTVIGSIALKTRNNQNLKGNNLTEGQILNNLNSYDERKVDSENLSIKVMQVPQYISGVASEGVSDPNFCSPLKQKKTDRVPRNIFSNNGTISIQSCVDNTFEQQKPQTLNHTLSSPQRIGSNEHSVAKVNRRDSGFNKVNQTGISSERNSKFVSMVAGRASPDRGSNHSRVGSEGSRLARSGAAMINIFKRGSQSPLKDGPHLQAMASRPTGSFGGLLNGSVASVNNHSPAPKVRDRLDSLSRVHIRETSIPASHGPKNVAINNSESKALTRASKFACQRDIVQRKSAKGGGDSSRNRSLSKKQSVRMQKLQKDIKSTYTPWEAAQGASSNRRSNRKSPRTGLQQQSSLHLTNQQKSKMAKAGPAMNRDYDVDLLTNELNGMKGSLPQAHVLRTSTSPRTNRPNFNHGHGSYR